MIDDREERVRQNAYQRWQDEGSPEGRHLEHWSAAEAAIGEADEKPNSAAASLDAVSSDRPAVTPSPPAKVKARKVSKSPLADPGSPGGTSGTGGTAHDQDR
jgi:hypothetical protein